MLGTKSSISSGLAKSFLRLGWIGFWLQIVIGSIPVALLIYALLFGKGGIGTRSGSALIAYLSIGSLALLAFTTIWFYRYTRLGRRIGEPDRRPSASSV
jgi:hypothetical protein